MAVVRWILASFAIGAGVASLGYGLATLSSPAACCEASSAPALSVAHAIVLTEPLPSTLILHLERLPAPWPNAGELVEPLSVVFVGEGDPIIRMGTLVSENGNTIAPVAQSPDSVRIDVVAESGSYRGLAEFATGHDERTTVEIVVNVRDFIAVPFATAVTGLLVALAANQWFTRSSPRRSLVARLREVESQSEKTAAKDRESMSSGEWLGNSREPYELVRGSEGLLPRKAAAALSEYDETPSFSVRDARWGSTGSELLGLRTLVDLQSSIGQAAISANEKLLELRTLLGDHAEEFFRSPVGTAAGSLLAGYLIDDEGDLYAVQHALDSLTQKVERLVVAAKALVRLNDLAEGLDERARFESIWARLRQPASSDEGELASINTDTLALWRDVHDRRAASQISEPRWDARLTDGLILDYGAGPGYVQPRFQRHPNRGERFAHMAGNLTFAVATGALATLAVLGAAYAPNPAFGSLSDYVSLLALTFAAEAAANFIKYVADTRLLPPRTADPSYT